MCWREMKEDASPKVSKHNEQKWSPAAKAFAGFLIGLCFVVAAGWVYLFFRALLVFLDWSFG